jgi:hypothetical protein
MSGLEVTLLIFGIWTTLGIVTLLALYPLLRAASSEPSARERVAPPASPVRRARRYGPPSALRESGYLGIVLERLALHATTIFGADQVCVFGRDPRTREDRLVLVQGTGVSPDLIGRPLDVHWDPMVAALACGRPLAVPGHLWPVWDGADAAPVQSAAMAPVWFAGRLQGAIGMTHRRDRRRLDMDGLARLGRLAELVGQALAHTDGRELSVADPQPEIDGLLVSLERAVPGSVERAEDVAQVARLLAEELGAGKADVIELDLAARLSRVGTIRLPAHPARSAGALTDTERELLRLEPLWSADMVARIPGLEAVALIVRHTRERWDGHGYPDALAGERIPLASRLIAAADVALAGAPVEELAGSSLDPQIAARIAAPLSASLAR